MNKKNIIAVGMALMLAASAVGCTTEEVGK